MSRNAKKRKAKPVNAQGDWSQSQFPDPDLGAVEQTRATGAQMDQGFVGGRPPKMTMADLLKSAAERGTKSQ